MERNDELYHYGVLGMKWGVHRATRKAKNNTKLINESNKYNIKSAKYNLKSTKRAAKDIGEGFATKSKKDVKRYLSANKRAAKYNLKSAKYKSKASKTPIKKQEPIKTISSLKTMTDDELRNRINRLQMEETYSRLTADPRKEQKKSAGKAFINSYGRVLSKRRHNKWKEMMNYTTMVY